MSCSWDACGSRQNCPDLDLVVVFQSGGKDSRSSEKTHGAVYCLENESPQVVVATSFRVRLIDDRQFTPKVAVLGPKTDSVHSVVVPCYLAGETILYQTTKDMKWTKTRLWSEGLREHNVTIRWKQQSLSRTV